MERAGEQNEESGRVSALVTWLRAPAAAPNVFARPSSEGFLARITLSPVLFATFALLAIALVWTTEIYVARNGIGDDGFIYASIIRAWNGHVQQLGLNGYTAQRCLNPIIIRLSLDVLHLPTDDAMIVKAYRVADAIAILTAIGFVILAFRHFKLSRAGLVVATCLTFFNFATLYWLPFDPVLTDGMALAIGGVQLWAYVSRRYIVLAIASAIGGFIWPSTAQVGAALLFFARPPDPAKSGGVTVPTSLPDPGPSAVDLGIAALLAAVITWFASGLADFAPPFGQLPAIKSLFRLSCACLCVIAFGGFKEMIRVGPSLRQLIRRDPDALIGKVLAVVMLIAVSKTLGWIAANPSRRVPQADDYTMAVVLKSSVFFAVQRPLVWIVAHAGFFGPGILFMVVCWRDVCNEARRIGFGMNAVVGIAFLLLLNSQSRAGIELVPIVLPLAALAAARLPWTPRRLWELAAITLIASKLWYTIVQKPVFDFASLMFNVGPWMTHEAYFYQLVAAVLATVWILWMRRQQPRPDEVVWLGEGPPSTVA